MPDYLHKDSYCLLNNCCLDSLQCLLGWFKGHEGVGTIVAILLSGCEDQFEEKYLDTMPSDSVRSMKMKSCILRPWPNM